MRLHVGGDLLHGLHADEPGLVLAVVNETAHVILEKRAERETQTLHRQLEPALVDQTNTLNIIRPMLELRQKPAPKRVPGRMVRPRVQTHVRAQLRLEEQR